MNVSLVLAVWYLCISAMFVYICRKCIYIFKRVTSSWRSGIITIRTVLDYMRSWARLMDDWRKNVIVSSHWSGIIQRYKVGYPNFDLIDGMDGSMEYWLGTVCARHSLRRVSKGERLQPCARHRGAYMLQGARMIRRVRARASKSSWDTAAHFCHL